MHDLVAYLDLPVLLVVGLRLGCLSHALLTASAIQQAGLTLAGWVTSQPEPEMPYAQENIAALEKRIAAPRLGSIPFLLQPDAEHVSKFLRMEIIIGLG
jgi:dethiobiotin synthetase